MKKGISLTVLGIIIVILTMITTVIVIDAKKYTDELKKTKFVTDYMLVERAVKKYYDDKGEDPIKKENTSNKTLTLIADIDAEETQFGQNLNKAKSGLNLSIIDVSLLGYDELTTGTGKSEFDYYGIDSDGNLYYMNGFEFDEKIYYMVTDNLK